MHKGQQPRWVLGINLPHLGVGLHQLLAHSDCSKLTKGAKHSELAGGLQGNSAAPKA
jgi:hypothetical protein